MFLENAIQLDNERWFELVYRIETLMRIIFGDENHF